ncbi:MAG: hypothetical protein GY750_02730 [Lentisphaerae bacterium]|nr:hypothetical protein [Lentisphaerota bacterium]
MKGLQEGFESARLVGSEVETVTFGSNLVAFQFSGGVLITALSEVIRTVGGEPLGSEQPPWETTRLPGVVGLVVKSSWVDATGRLVVGFGEDSSLAFVPDDSGYESFIVSMDGEEWFA